MTTSPLKVEDSRAQFEAWFSSRKESMKRCGLGMIAIRRAHDAAWSAWQASRAAIVVELPDEVNVLLNHLEDVLPFDVFNLIDVKKWNAVSSLSAAGITVKGD